MLRQLKIWILAAAAILLVEKTVLYFLTHGKEQELAGLETECNQLKLKQTSLSAQIGKQQLKLSAPEHETGLSSGGGKPAAQMETATFLQHASRLVENLGIKYISIQLNPGQPARPGEQAKSARSYNVRVSSDYPQIVRLVDNIENQLNLDVGNIRVSSGKDDTGLHEASFDLALLKTSEEKGLSAPAESSAMPQQSLAIAKKEVGKDPFYQIPVRASKTSAEEKPDPELPQLHGIMEVMGKRAALLNHQVMHEGDKIKDYEVVRIDSNRVELKRYNRKYLINLRGLVSMADAEAMKGKL